MTPTQREAAERLADERPVRIDDDLYAWAIEASVFLRELAAEPVQEPDLVRDFPAVKAAKKAAEAELGYYREMMAAEPVQEPLFWVRLRSDGGYEGPIAHSAIEEVRRQSGAWTPLYAAPQQPMRCPTDGGECGAGGYCRPEPKQRRPLTDKDIVALLAWDDYLGGCITLLEFARAIERAHGIGETP